MKKTVTLEKTRINQKIRLSQLIDPTRKADRDAGRRNGASSILWDAEGIAASHCLGIIAGSVLGQRASEVHTPVPVDLNQGA
jgi:hypothetical protein